MGFTDRISVQLYALVKRNRKVRDLLMPAWSWMSKAYIKTRSLVTRAEILPPPHAVSESTEVWINNARSREPASAHSFYPVYTPREIKRKPPKTIEDKVHWKFRINETCREPATFVARIAGGRVYGEGAVISPDDHLLADVSRTIDAGAYVKDPFRHPVFGMGALPPLQEVRGNVAVLSAAGGRGYYHWMFDVLPRLHLLRKAGFYPDSIDKFLINNYVSRFHVESLNILGIPREKVLESHWNPHIRAEHLVVPSLVGDTGHIPAYACEFLRKEFLGVAPAADSPKRLYFNRGQVTHRRVTNEGEIIRLLTTRGFKSIALESQALADQVALLANAEAVIVPHGAGLTNTVFCRPGTKIIELLSPNAVNVMYWTLSNQVGLDYYYLLAEGPREPDFVDSYLNNENLTINIQDLEAMLDLAGIR